MPSKTKKVIIYKKGTRRRINMRSLAAASRRKAVRGLSRSTIYSPFTQGAIHYFKRSFLLATLTASNAGVQNWAYSFQLSDLPSYTEFTTLFDQYKFIGVKIKMLPVNTQVSIIPQQSPVTAYGAIGVPMMCTVIDYDDASALSAKNDYLQYQNCQMFQCVKQHNRYFQPRLAMSNYTGSFGGYSNLRPQWIDCNTNNTQHYGFKVFMEQAGANMNGEAVYEIYATYYLKFRNVR